MSKLAITPRSGFKCGAAALVCKALLAALSLGSSQPVPNLQNNRIIDLAIGRISTEGAAFWNTQSGAQNQAKSTLQTGQPYSFPLTQVAGDGLPRPVSQQRRLVYLTFPGFSLAGESLL